MTADADDTTPMWTEPENPARMDENSFYKLSHDRSPHRWGCLQRAGCGCLVAIGALALLLIHEAFSDSPGANMYIQHRMAVVARMALYDYYADHGRLPEPENGRLPTVLLAPKDYVTTRVAAVFKKPMTLLPIDPFDQGERGTTETRYTAWVWLGNISHRDGSPVPNRARGLPLRYYTSGDMFAIVGNSRDGTPEFSARDMNPTETVRRRALRFGYDPSNGTVSPGDLIFIGQPPPAED